MKQKPNLLPNPVPYKAGYTLTLFCKYLSPDHAFNEFPHVFTGEHGPDVFRQAWQKGWLIHKDQTAACPKCAPPKKTYKKGLRS